LTAKFRVDGAPGTVSSSRSWRRSRESAIGFGRDADARDGLFRPLPAEAPRAAGEARRVEADGRAGAVRFVAVARDFGAALRDRFAVVRAARAFGRAAFRAEALRAGRDALRVALLVVLPAAFLLPAFALRFAITNVLSASRVLSREDGRNP
jgi:hypothetical protein